MLSNEEFKKMIEKFLQEEPIAASKFGLKAMNDPSLVIKIRDGRELRESNKRRVIDYICRMFPVFAQNNISEKDRQ